MLMLTLLPVLGNFAMNAPNHSRGIVIPELSTGFCDNLILCSDYFSFRSLAIFSSTIMPCIIW